MATDYLPVTSRCPTCKNLHVEWVHDADTIGRVPGWNPKVQCDECFVAKALPMYQEMIRKQAANRKQQMFERNKNADLRYLDPVHKAMFLRKLAGTSENKSVCTLLTHTQDEKGTIEHTPSLPESAENQAAT